MYGTDLCSRKTELVSYLAGCTLTFKLEVTAWFLSKKSKLHFCAAVYIFLSFLKFYPIKARGNGG